jgi:predicted MFS family arabinose efflux permease
MNRDAFRALRHRNYRIFSAGQLVSLVGTWMQTIAQGWLVYRITRQPAMLGVASFAALAPSFILGSLGGVVADRVDPRRLAMGTQAALLVQALVLGILTLMGNVRIAPILALAAFMGVVNAFDLPARQVLVARTVPREDLPNAIALNSSIFHGSRILGPGIAGLVVAASGEGWCFILNAASYLAALLALWALHSAPGPSASARSGVIEHLREGFRYVRETRKIRRLFLLLGGVSLLAFPYVTLLPAFARDVLGTDARGLGWIMAASGVGATLGALALASRKDTEGLRRNMVAATFLLGLVLAGFSATRSLAWACAAIVPLGFLMVSHMTANNTLLQIQVPDALRGRVMALHAMIFMGAVPLGGLIGGLLAHGLGVPRTMALGGIGCSAGAILFAWTRRTSAEPTAPAAPNPPRQG